MSNEAFEKWYKEKYYKYDLYPKYAPTIQREGWVNDKDTLALDVARKIMLDVSTIMIPVDVRRVSQLQAKIQVVIAELLQAAPTVQREGWVSVPIEPTEEMIENAKWEDGKLTAINVYKLMLEAAPKE